MNEDYNENDNYDDSEYLEDSNIDNPDLVDTASKSATHVAGKIAAGSIGGVVGERAYDALSRTRVGQALEDAVANRVGFRIRLFIIIGSFFFFLLFFLIFAAAIDFDGSESEEVCVNLPAIDSVCKSITPSGYSTMSVDEYVAGVINGEVGLFNNKEVYKVYAIAARSYALAGATKDGSGNCTVPVGPSFQAYVPNPNKDMQDAASETSGVVLVRDSNIVSSEYDALCVDHDDSVNYYLCQGGTGEEHLAVPKSWINSHLSQADFNYLTNLVHGRGMSQYGSLYLVTDRNWEYTKILDYFYGDEGVSMASINGATSKCTSSNNGSFEPLSTYNLSANGLNVLDRTLSNSEQNELNNYINSEVDKAGFGTGGGVAAAGQALAYWLEQKGYYLQYRWGGGHSYPTNNGCDLGGTFVGVNPNWGSSNCGYDDSRRSRIYYGFDCSGFVSWAIRTACKPSGFNDLAGDWASLYGKKISLSEAKPGDVLDSAAITEPSPLFLTTNRI